MMKVITIVINDCRRGGKGRWKPYHKLSLEEKIAKEEKEERNAIQKRERFVFFSISGSFGIHTFKKKVVESKQTSKKFRFSKFSNLQKLLIRFYVLSDSFVHPWCSTLCGGGVPDSRSQFQNYCFPRFWMTYLVFSQTWIFTSFSLMSYFSHLVFYSFNFIFFHFIIFHNFSILSIAIL